MNNQAQLREWFLVRFLIPAFVLIASLGALSYVNGGQTPRWIISVACAIFGLGLGLYLFMFVAMAVIERRKK